MGPCVEKKWPPSNSMEAKPLKKGKNDLSKSHVKCTVPPISRDSSWEKSGVLGIILDVIICQV